jgi:hypothetical protein
MSASIPPGTQWLRQQTDQKQRKLARKPELEDLFTREQNYARNRQWAKPGNYWTKLNPQQEQQFRGWLKANPSVLFDPDEDKPDYDMRGFWLGLQNGDPHAIRAIDKNDINPATGQPNMHEDDWWKTPYDASFSADSQWGIPGKTPTWVNDRFLQMPNGRVMWDDQSKTWFGTGQEPGG